MLNTKTNEFLEALTKLVNECGLPPVNVRLALDNVRLQVAALEKAAVEQEKAQAKSETAGEG